MSPSESLDELVYSSKLAEWDSRASVRIKPRRELCCDEDQPDYSYFPVGLVPTARHELVLRRGPAAVERVLVQRLYAYLDFTTELEMCAINPMCVEISRGRTGFALPPGILEDAFKIYTDEAWHAQFSDDLLRQVTRCTGQVAALPDRPAFVARVAAVAEELPPEVRRLVRLFFAIVSETLISAVLSDIPNDAQVAPAVREVVRDHAIDEGVHHSYFSHLLTYVWPQLGGAERAAIGTVVPRLIRAFLEPDWQAHAAALRCAGLTLEEVGQVLCDCYTDQDVARTVRGDAHATIRYFERLGAFSDSATLEAFQAAGLVDG
jgi:hypothetical protein